MRRAIGRRVFPFLAILIALFAFRVMAQLLQAAFALPFLPPYDSWHSGALPYAVLVTSQIAILMVICAFAWQVRNGSLSPGPWRHKACFILGGAYFVLMVFRLIAGLTLLSHVPWFTAQLPTVFHLVLATYIMGVGHYLQRIQGKLE